MSPGEFAVTIIALIFCIALKLLERWLERRENNK